MNIIQFIIIGYILYKIQAPDWIWVIYVIGILLD